MRLVSPLRRAEHRALSKVSLDGEVLDLGGGRFSKYRTLFKGDYNITIVNLDQKTKPEITHDLEKILPIEDEQYNAVLMINVLEHIYNHKQLVDESYRVLRADGDVVVAVPFMFPDHPSPNDYFRYTSETLEKLFTDAGFEEIKITSLGSGVFMTSIAMFDRLMPFPIRMFTGTVVVAVAYVCDKLFYGLARLTKRKYNPERYALGYVLEAKK